MAQQSTKTINGVGKPRLLVGGENVYSSIGGETYGSTSVMIPLVKAADFNGIDERCYKSNPVGMDLNASERITSSTDRDFETTIGSWIGAGNHSIVLSTLYKKTGLNSGKITATGAGDGSTNYAQLPSSAFTVFVVGEKYVYELWTYGDTAGVTLGLTVGDKTITGKTIYSATPGTFKKTVFRFQATASTINQPIRLYLSGAGSCYIDDVSLTQGFDELVIGWVKSNVAAGQRIFSRQSPDLWTIYESATGKLSLYLSTTGGNDDVVFDSSQNINTGAWVLFAHTIDQAGDAKVYVNGVVGGSASIANLGKFSPVPTFEVAAYFAGYSNLIIGQSQIVHFTSLPADIETQILNASNNGIPATWSGGTMAAHYKWQGTDDATFLKDETGNNNLTGVNVTQAGDQIRANYASITETLSSKGIRIGMVASSVVGGSPDKPVYGKVTAVSDPTHTLAIDEWKGGVPTDGKSCSFGGWVIDLPRCQEMTEVFGPDYLMHPLYGGDQGKKVETKFRGWTYRCILDYSKFTTGDMLYDLQPALNRKSTDRLVLIPRVDAPEFQYNVFFAEEISLSKYGKSPGYRKPVFVFVSKENLASWPIQSGYGYGYARNYGNQF